MTDSTPTDLRLLTPTLPELARACAKNRYRVFPLHTAIDGDKCTCHNKSCQTPGAHPRIDDWAIQATSSPKLVAQWWKRWPDANVGLVGNEVGSFVCVDPSKALPHPSNEDPETVTIPSGKVFQGFQRALLGKEKWTFSSTDVPYYRDDSTDLVYSYGGHRGGGESMQTCELANRTLQENISVLDPQTGLIALISMAKWIAAKQNGTLSEELSVTIHVNDILDIMARDRHPKGGYRVEQKLEISRRFAKLDAFKVTGPNPKAKDRSLHGSLFNITMDAERGLLDKDKKLVQPLIPFAFLVRPGQGFSEFLVATQMELADFFIALARLKTRPGTMECIAYHIGIYIVFQNRIRESTQNFDQPFRISTILERQNVPIPTDARRFSKFREHVDAAFDRLQADGVIADWRYVPGDEENLPTYGWFKQWMNCRVIIDPPQIVRERAQIRDAGRRDHSAANQKSETKQKPTADSTARRRSTRLLHSGVG